MVGLVSHHIGRRGKRSITNVANVLFVSLVQVRVESFSINVIDLANFTDSAAIRNVDSSIFLFLIIVNSVDGGSVLDQFIDVAEGFTTVDTLEMRLLSGTSVAGCDVRTTVCSCWMVCFSFWLTGY